MREGGCFCGFIRYAIRGAPFNETSCHCTICRGTTGAPFVAWFSVRAGELTFVSGEPTTFSSSDHGTRSFCPRCGTQLTFRSTHFPDEVDVTTCSLDHPDAVPPKDHTFASRRVPWVRLADRLPTFAERRE